MHRNSAILTVVGLAVLGMAPLPVFADLGQSATGSPHRTRPTPRQTAQSAGAKAEALIEKSDYAAAEPLLLKAVADDPKDWQAWYYLGYVYSATERNEKAIEAYRHAVTENPKLFEANLNLGLLLATAGNRPEAAKFLTAATTLKPESEPEQGLFRAYYALGRLLAADNPTGATAALKRATELRPREAAPHVELAQLLEKQQDAAGAEKEYLAASALEPNNLETATGLANIYTRSKRLPEAENALRKVLALSPKDAAAHLQLARVLTELKKTDEATAEFAAAQQLTPNDPEILKESAKQQLAAKKYAEAEASLRTLIQLQPKDPELHFAIASALLNQHKYADAQQAYLMTVKLKPDWGEAYSELAVAASSNKDYMLCLRALAARAKFLPETPGTYFLRATAFDHLKDFKQASDNYKHFLAEANGKFPDQEWQARHRLIAIDPETRAKHK
jgi:Flp pilus assembly protein TadD